MRPRLHLRCPDCGSEMEVDAATGEIVSHHAVERPASGAKDFDALLQGLEEGRVRAEARFEQERASLRDRSRILEEKFEEARKKAEERGLEGPPDRPWDLD